MNTGELSKLNELLGEEILGKQHYEKVSHLGKNILDRVRAECDKKANDLEKNLGNIRRALGDLKDKCDREVNDLKEGLDITRGESIGKMCNIEVSFDAAQTRFLARVSGLRRISDVEKEYQERVKVISDDLDKAARRHHEEVGRVRELRLRKSDPTAFLKTTIDKDINMLLEEDVLNDQLTIDKHYERVSHVRSIFDKVRTECVKKVDDLKKDLDNLDDDTHNITKNIRMIDDLKEDLVDIMAENDRRMNNIEATFNMVQGKFFMKVEDSRKISEFEEEYRRKTKTILSDDLDEITNDYYERIKPFEIGALLT